MIKEFKVIDGHADIWIDVDEKRQNGENDIFKKYHMKKFLDGQIAHSVFAVWLENNCTDKEIIEMFKNIAVEINNNKDILHSIKKYEDFEIAEVANKLGVIISLESLHYIDRDIELIDIFYLLGAREASLTWNESNQLGTGVGGDENRGITDLGFKALKKIEKLGMMFDVSHLNEKSFWDVINKSSKPIIASHSNSKVLCNHPRNLTDDQIKAIAETGGFIGLNSVPMVVSEDNKNLSIDKLVNHLDHLVNIAGIDKVGFGFDFYDYLEEEENNTTSMDYDIFIPEFKNVSDVPNLLKALVNRGYSKDEINKICIENFKNYAKKILI